MTRHDDLYTNADLYDAQYRDYRADLPFYRRLAEDQGGAVLELGCGTGRVTAELARTGAEVVAIDASEAMLARADARLTEAGVRERVELRRADMRDPDALADLGRRFALVVAPFNTLMHAYTLDEQDATLRGARHALTDGGVFACDCYRPDFGAFDVVRRERTWERVGGERAELYLVQHHDPARQIVESRYHLDRIDADGRVRRESSVLRQRYFHRFELERALRCAGFGRVRLYGDFDRRPPAADARHWVALAHR